MLRKVASYLVGAVVVLVLAAGAMHVFIPVLNPDQETPKRHVVGPCWGCHVVTPSADLIELDE